MLISVNPFKQMPYFTDREIELYQGAVRMLCDIPGVGQGFTGFNLVQNTWRVSRECPHPPFGCCRSQCFPNILMESQ